MAVTGVHVLLHSPDATVRELTAKGVEVRGEPEQRRFGRAVILVLPGEVEVLLYQPEHPTAV